ncbi:MAG: hypothetical protein AAB420_03915 [Patescibacteria group bacterium]
MDPEMQELMTLAQGGALAGRGIDKKVLRRTFEDYLNDGRATDFLEAMVQGKLYTNRLQLAIGIGLVRAPEGGQIVFIPNVPVQPSRPWIEALEAAGPQTDQHFNVRKVGDLYKPKGSGLVTRDLVVLNWPGHGLAEHLAWAKQYEALLTGTDPRTVFAAAEHNPQLHRKLGMDPAWLIATEECTFDGGAQLCYVFFDGDKRKSSLYWSSNVGLDDDWVAFSSK